MIVIIIICAVSTIKRQPTKQPSVLWRYWLGERKGIWTVENLLQQTPRFLFVDLTLLGVVPE